MKVFTFQTETLRIVKGKKKRVRKDIKVEVPERIEEINLRKWVDFNTLRTKSPEWFTTITSEFTDDQKPSVAIPAEKWPSFISHALDVVWCLAGNREELKREDLTKLPLGGAVADQSADSLLAILAIIMEPIRSYEPKARETFRHNGYTYAFYTNYLDQFGHNWVGKDLRVAEAVDALQFEHVFFQRDEEGNLISADGPYKNDLALLSMLSRRVNDDGTLEDPPIKLADRTPWLDQRMKDLQGVSMDIARDLDFFLPRSSAQLVNTLLSALRGKTGYRQRA
jgi:hypothetical protein